MGIFEFLMLFCFCFSWPFSIAKSYRSRSTKDNFNWVTWAYVAGLTLVAIDLALYWRNWRLERTSRDNQKGIENGQT